MGTEATCLAYLVGLGQVRAARLLVAFALAAVVAVACVLAVPLGGLHMAV